ncbi:unnamed protein product [Symbiodinium sp. CCMP2592]|nr:unnamed protein product [Symbiodinium sp. CCMP2592]
MAVQQGTIQLLLEGAVILVGVQGALSLLFTLADAEATIDANVADTAEPVGLGDAVQLLQWDAQRCQDATMLHVQSWMRVSGSEDLRRAPTPTRRNFVGEVNQGQGQFADNPYSREYGGHGQDRQFGQEQFFVALSQDPDRSAAPAHRPNEPPTVHRHSWQPASAHPERSHQEDPRAWQMIDSPPRKDAGAPVDNLPADLVECTGAVDKAEYHSHAADLFTKLPPEASPVIFQGDINAPFSWVQSDRGDVAAGRTWELQRLQKASQCDWTYFQELRAEGQGSWDAGFAECQSGDPHAAVAEHLSAVYQGTEAKPIVEPTGEARGFSVDEVKLAVGQMKRGKAVGIDLTSRELFEGLLSVPGGASHLAEFFTQILVSRKVPADWNVSVLILLAKIPQPLGPRDLRPIALGSAASKLFSRLLLNRSLPFLGPRSPYQCARQHRQSCDYVFSVWRIFELCREWGLPLTCAKIDVQKAFDSVSRPRLIEKLRSRLGDTPEMACWEQLLHDTRALLVSPWGVSGFLMQSGIKQGAVESPSFFGLLMEEALEETARAFEWHRRPKLFADFEWEAALFMDDGAALWCIAAIPPDKGAFYGYAEGLGGATCFSRMTGNLHIEFKHSMGPSWMAGTLMLLRYGRGAGVQGVGMAGMVAFLGLGVSGQPVDALGNFPPFWYVNARAGADTLLWERGVNPNHLLGCTARLIEARGDPRYSQFTSLLMADFEVATGGDLRRALVCEREQQDVWQWARYVDEWMHVEYLETFFPVQQNELERISPEGLGTVDSLPVPAEEENLVERVRREHFNTFLVLPALQRRLHGLEPNTQGAVGATSDGPLTRALGEWMLDAIDFLRDERARGEDGCAVHLLRGRMLGRRDQRYRGLAIEVLAGLDDVVPAGFIQTVEPPEYLVDWARDVEGELYELLHYRSQGACGSDATSFVQREVKQKGLALDEEVDAQPGVIDRLTLVLAFQGVVGRLLRMIGMIVEDALTEERSGPDWSPPEGDGDGDDTSLMQSALVTTDNDWYLFLADFRNALEPMTKEARLANSQVIWRWLDHRVTDSLSGKCLGHARGRAGEVLALLVAAMESSAGFLAGEHHLGVCTAWFQRLALFVPTVPGSRRDRGLPVSQELPAPVLFQKPLPLESDSDDAEETANRRLMRTNRQSERDLDALVEEERRDRAELVEHSEAMEAMQAAAEEEEAAETQRLADDFLEEEGGLRDLSPASYRAWEDRVFKRALQGPPTRKRAYLDVELASGSSDAPRVSRRWRVPLPQSGVAFSLTATVVHEEDIADTPPAAVAGGTGVTVPGPLATDVALTAGGTAAEGTDTDVDTVLVPGSGVPVTTQLDVGELCSASAVAGEPGFDDRDRFQFTDLSMEQFQQLYGQWMGGLVSTAEVQATHGCDVAEMLELQFVAVFRRQRQICRRKKGNNWHLLARVTKKNNKRKFGGRTPCVGLSPQGFRTVSKGCWRSLVLQGLGLV